MNTLQWLSNHFIEVDPFVFYRELFPVGELDEKDAFSKGKYCGIAIQVAADNKAKRYSITDDLDVIQELINQDDFVVISPLSYAGKAMTAVNQRQLFAIAIDLDNLIVDGDDPTGIRNLIHQTSLAENKGDRFAFAPRPTYVAASGDNNVHLYYLLDEPIPLYKSNRECLSRYKRALTDRLWNEVVTSSYNEIQQEPIGQGMRAVGSIRKDSQGRVRAFKTGDRVSIDYLNSYRFPESYNAKIELWDNADHNKKIDYGSRKATTVKPAFYDWYKRQLDDKKQVGKRYFQLMVMAIIGLKCGISYDTVIQDALDLVPMMDSITTEEKNHFTKDDALKAVTAYNVAHFMFMRRETLVNLSGVPMEPNKRNGRTRQAHMKRLNRIIDLDIEDGEKDVRYHGGAPTKKDLIVDYWRAHQLLSNRQIARDLGVSLPTVNKWVRWSRENQ